MKRCFWGDDPQTHHWEKNSVIPRNLSFREKINSNWIKWHVNQYWLVGGNVDILLGISPNENPFQFPVEQSTNYSGLTKHWSIKLVPVKKDHLGWEQDCHRLCHHFMQDVFSSRKKIQYIRICSLLGNTQMLHVWIIFLHSVKNGYMDKGKWPLKWFALYKLQDVCFILLMVQKSGCHQLSVW